VKILGLTGSIGMGKSTAARMFRRLGIPLHDADAAVHRLLGKGGAAVAAVGLSFPGVVKDGAVDRRALGAQVFGDTAGLKLLESILHPLVQAEKRRFLRACRARRAKLVVLDIPLLYETGGEKTCDAVLVVTAPQFLQDQRVLSRPNMDRDRLTQIRRQQMPDAEKRRRADFVVQTGLGQRPTLIALKQAIRELIHK
jgi:dephospho-CoA kinase